MGRKVDFFNVRNGAGIQEGAMSRAVRLVLDGSDNNGEIMTRAEAEKRIAALLGCHVADLVTEPLVDGSGDSYYASEEARAADDGSVGPAPRIDDLEAFFA